MPHSYMKPLSLITLCIALAASTCALSARNPRGCKDAGIHFEGSNLVLMPNLHATVFLIQNTAGRQIRMERVLDSNNPLIIKLSTKLRPYSWTSLALDHPSIEFECFATKYRNQRPVQAQVSCVNALHVCQFARTKFAAHNEGTYWVIQNKSKQGIVAATIGKGILLR